MVVIATSFFYRPEIDPVGLDLAPNILIQIAACGSGVIALCVGVTGALAAAAGGGIEDVLKAMAFTVASYGVWGGVGGVLHGIESSFTTASVLASSAVHGVVNGALSLAQGGSFIDGFVSGAIDQAAGMFAMNGPLGAIGGNGGATIRSIFAGAAGGAASELTGGKFMNGFVTAAFAQMWNGEADFFKPLTMGGGNPVTALSTHSYIEGPNLVCSSTCTAKQVAELLSSYSMPGSPGRHVEDKGSYTVYFGPVLGGIVTVRVFDAGLRIENSTTAWHVFCCGKIERTVSRGLGGDWYAKTIGTGMNFSIAGPMNQYMGPLIFRWLDHDMLKASRQ